MKSASAKLFPDLHTVSAPSGEERTLDTSGTAHPLLSGPPTLNDIHHHGMRSSPLGADTVCKSTRNSFADALFTQGLMALMQPIICCVSAQSAREFVTEFSGGATPHRSGVAQS